MQERAKRLAIAVVLTVVDVVTFNIYFGAIWQAWGGDPWARAALLGLLALWIASAVVLWIHVSYDIAEEKLSNPSTGLILDLMPR